VLFSTTTTKKVIKKQNKKMSGNQIPNIIIAGFTGDRSGSMISMGHAPTEGLHSWIVDQKKSIEENSQIGKMFVSTFDSNHEIHIDGENISDVNVTIEQCREWMEPRSMTKLYDSAIADLNKLIQAKIDYERNMPRSLRILDPKIVIVWACMTDGADNESEATIEDFKNKVKEARDLHDAKCFFLGANQDAVMTGAQFGFSQDCSLTFGASGPAAANALRSVTQVMRNVSEGSQNIGFTQMMRQSSAPASFGERDTFDTAMHTPIQCPQTNSPYIPLPPRIQRQHASPLNLRQSGVSLRQPNFDTDI
tara:strand:+ start:107 stop:1027 length:921 start_codon:yes stop_codon:yes gene_type:complete